MEIKQVPGQNSQKIETGKSTAKPVTPDQQSEKNLQNQSVANDDRVEISSLAGNLQKSLDGLNAIPEINTAKVESIKNAIDSGSFKVNSESVATKLVDFELTFSK